MTYDREPMYWKENPEWSYWDEKGDPHIKDDAPERVKRSFEMWNDTTRPM